MLEGLTQEQLQTLHPKQICQLMGVILEETWQKTARKNQLPPKKNDWFVLYFRAGRGSGKTRAAAEWISKQALLYPGTRWAVVAPTYRDGIDICFEGDSGILNIIPPELIGRYNRTDGKVELLNGSRISLYTAEKPSRLRGPQFHGGWIDEPGSMDATGEEIWFQLQAGLRLRLSDDSGVKVFISGTPKKTEFMEILDQLCNDHPQKYILRTGSTLDNEENLAPGFIEEIVARYGGTSRGKQEIEGILVTEVDGAQLKREHIEAHRIRVKDQPEYRQKVIAVDPALSKEKRADKTGIILAGEHDNHVYIVEDHTIKASVSEWGHLIVRLALENSCPIVCERNLAWPLIRDVLKGVDRSEEVIIRPITARGTKQERSQPVAALYQNGYVHHVGFHDKLEEQWCTHVFHENRRGKSPDRIDACVHAVTSLRLQRSQMTASRPRGTFRF